MYVSQNNNLICQLIDWFSVLSDQSKTIVKVAAVWPEYDEISVWLIWEQNSSSIIKIRLLVFSGSRLPPADWSGAHKLQWTHIADLITRLFVPDDKMDWWSAIKMVSSHQTRFLLSTWLVAKTETSGRAAAVSQHYHLSDEMLLGTILCIQRFHFYDVSSTLRL